MIFKFFHKVEKKHNMLFENKNKTLKVPLSRNIIFQLKIFTSQLINFQYTSVEKVAVIYSQEVKCVSLMPYYAESSRINSFTVDNMQLNNT